jgi:WD40 repeat protein
MADETIGSSIINKSGQDFFLTKASRAGGPVTCVAYSPSKPSTQPKDDDNSFFFVAQGPYLTRYKDRGAKYDVDVDVDFDANVNIDATNNPQQLLVFTENGGQQRGGGSIHGIHFLENETSTSKAKAKKISTTSWDSIVYGGKRLAFCNLLGGGCGGDDGSTSDIKIERRDVILTEAIEATAKTEINRNLSSLPTSPFLELGDWIWNVKTFSVDDNDTDSTNKMKTTKMVVGYARHMLEVWNIEESITDIEDGHDECIDKSAEPSIRRTAIISTCLRRFFLSPSTVVTSMDFIFVKQQQNQHDTISTQGDHSESHTLWIAAGTSFHKIWISCIPMNDIINPPIIEEEKEQSNNRMDLISSSSPAPKNYLLEGHIGVVHCVRWFNDGGVISLASTSDDRSVRKWVWDVTQQHWVEKWIGWGHSARVWSVAMVNPASPNEQCSTSSDLMSTSSSTSSPSPVLVSVAEDGTARVWSTESGETLACIHHSTTLRTVDTRSTMDGGMMLIGTTDGISAIYDVYNHISGETRYEVPIPDDRPQEIIVKPNSDDMESAITSITHAKGENQNADTLQTIKKKKKKKKKKKMQAQVILGMKCWRDVTNNSTPQVIVATRQGTLMSLNIDNQDWHILEPWWEKSIGERYGIQASDGCCMAVHDTMCAVAIGTTRGDIVLTSFHKSKDTNSTILNARGLRGVQGLSFIYSTCLVSFHVQSVALWNMDFENAPNTLEVQPNIVLKVETKGIPLSCAYDRVNHRAVVGDSRGNLVYFNTKNSDSLKGSLIEPTSTLHRVHQKQHIMSIKWLNTDTIISAGNDGCLHISYLDGDFFRKGWSYPAPSMNGITAITHSSGPIIVAGYYGNVFRMLDTGSGCEFFRADTGGRQRILNHRVDTGNNILTGIPLVYQLAVCKGLKDGSNNLFVQHSSTHPRRDEANGVKLHVETIFDSTFFTLTNQEIVFLVTVSEDCNSRISAWRKGRIIDSVLLTPQESCCRCVAISKVDEKSVLLVVGGGKLTLQFFLVKERSNLDKINSTRDLDITFIGNGSTWKKGATIDHRINAVNAIPLIDGEHRSHLVVAGDSDGGSHIFLITGDGSDGCKNIRSLLVPTMSERPILCIEMLAIGNRILIMMGSTGGDIAIFELPASLSQLEDYCEGSNWWYPIGGYQGHQMGTNTIFAQILSMEITNNMMNATVSIVTGGDDQALCISRISLEQINDCDTRLKLVRDADLNVISEASFSAIKGVSIVSFRDQKYLFAVGYSQQLSVWRFHSKDDMSLQCKSRVSVDLGDINSLSVYQPSDESTCFVAVCGMGVEMFQQG